MKLSTIFKDQPLIALHAKKRKLNHKKKQRKTPTLTWDPFGGMSGYPDIHTGRMKHGATSRDG